VLTVALPSEQLTVDSLIFERLYLVAVPKFKDLFILTLIADDYGFYFLSLLGGLPERVILLMILLV
jgi:hypothetical protein